VMMKALAHRLTRAGSWSVDGPRAVTRGYRR
jgi:hypothetical protein